MDERSCAEAVGAWLGAEIPALTVYDYPISNSNGPLPDAVVLVREKRVTGEVPDELAELGLEQVWVRLFTVETSIMVGLAEQTEAAADAADATLRGYGATIESRLWADPSLGERVEVCSPELVIDYGTPFARREDGTTGRFSIVTFTVAEAIASPE